ncbi:MAG TPA: serine/threonine-protein kinase [Methylomirabilota bacterium]|nr:serine/threonine-protein kinase [Methylomirabilota bacterium]
MRVGRYEILEVIGKGASGRVARAHDPLIDRIVAIKLLPPEFSRGELREAFLKEARVAGRLSHPAVITLHDIGVDEATSTPYLVMEHVEGLPLDRVLAKGSIPFPRACAWTAEIACALAAAHRTGVIHGDVKPANVLITEANRVKLTDFGMARLSRRDSLDSSLLGTPAYWSPEQIAGKPQDARSDIFSTGVVLYEMVAGQAPFQGESLQALCGQILSANPLRLSHLIPSLPGTLDAVVERCLAKQPAERFSDAEQLAEALYPLARRKAEEPAQVPPPKPSLRQRLRVF